MVLDIIIIGIPVFIFSCAIFGTLFFDLEKMEAIKDNDYQALYLLYKDIIWLSVGIIVSWSGLLGFFILGKKQATPGKAIMGLKIISTKGDLKFFQGFMRFSSLPLLLLAIQTPARQQKYSALEQIAGDPKIAEDKEKLAELLNTPLDSITSIIVIALISVWYLLIVYSKERTAIHDMLFDTRVIKA